MLRLTSLALAMLALGLAACEPNAPGTGSSRSHFQGTPAYAQCMRAHGIPDFPDPDSNGWIDVTAGPGSDLDPQSQAFQKARSACHSLLPASNGETTT
jgi:hypothetical protein